MTEYFRENVVQDKLRIAMLSDSESFEVRPGRGSKFPSEYPYFVIIEGEQVKVTNKSVDTFTCARAQLGTVAEKHEVGTRVRVSKLGDKAKSLEDEVSAQWGRVGYGSYAGNGGTGRAIPHGLGGIPALVLVYTPSSIPTLFWHIRGRAYFRSLRVDGTHAGSEFAVTAPNATNFYSASGGTTMNASGYTYYWVAIR